MVRRLRLALAASAACALFAAAQPALLPPGGTVRSLAADPFHPGAVLLGTTTGVLFRSADAGAEWSFYSRIAEHDDWVVSSLVPDRSQPGRWYASLWSWANPDGGVYRSENDGQSWQPVFQHHAVRALALAGSDPRILVAATLDGVYRTLDAGAHWQLISPPGDRELMNIESVAIDPADPQQIYVGTWHLPWKTFDGGHDWWQMRQGVIDDSDVFSIAVDRLHPATVYLSACSGIYRSDDRGNQFRKIQGIPYSARRTPALVQDPADPSTIYAGTTQGLWVTHDQGDTWRRLTDPALRVNAVLLLPGRILLGTDFAGVYASGDGGQSFHSANAGFANRHVSSVAAGPQGRYLSVTGDEAWGGVFFQGVGDSAWRQLPLPPGDVYALHWSSGGLLAATAQGIFRLSPPYSRHWELPRTSPRSHIYALASPDPASPVVLAATETGLYRSSDGGLTWAWMRAAPAPLFQLLLAPGETPATTWLFVAGDGYVLRSSDQGRHFLAGRLALDGAGAPRGRIHQLAAAALPGGGQLILAATTRGLYRSADEGATWTLCGHGLPATDVSSVRTQGGAIFALTASVGQAFRSGDGGAHWTPVHLPADVEALTRSAPDLEQSWHFAASGLAAAPASRRP